MNDNAIAPDVLAFIEQYIDTVPHMEALLLILESRPRLWNDTMLAQRLYTDPATAQRILSDLERRKLIFLESSADPRQYRAAEDSTILVEKAVQAYRRNLVAVARFIHSKGSPAMREFARAFQFKDK